MTTEKLRHALALEEQVWRAVQRRDGAALGALFSDDYAEVTLEGKRVLKDAIVEQSPQVDEIESYAIAEPRVIELGDDCLLLTYHLTIKGRCRGVPISPSDRWATSIWRKTESDWRCCFYQQSAHAAE